ncbi:hypothetical protein F4861DRAFT_247341 [Xylaria intraflava]|nr:hypothetical protein F4861DRAFT_247341 [Xylaria intraflava]
MHFSPVFLAAVTTALSASFISARFVRPSHHKNAKPEFDELWTLNEVSRNRNSDRRTCEWHMTIDRYSTDLPPGNENDTITCDFQVRTGRGSDCGVAPFGRQRCNRSRHSFYVSGANIDDDDYFVLTVENKREDKRAVFGYNDALLDSGADIPAQTSLVTHIEEQGVSALLARQSNHGGEQPLSDEN